METGRTSIIVPYRICGKCIMDTTDPEITFDGDGVCNHCRSYDELVRTQVISGAEGRRWLEKVASMAKRAGARSPYDCIIGVSGGVDSTYVAYVVKQLGLRPLAVHLDNGWDSELAVKNIENVLKKLDIELYTHVIDWEEFKDLQLAFLRASTPDSEIPSDHAIFALLHRMAASFNVRYVFPGTNIRTETHLPLAWSQGHHDWRYIKSVHDRFGSVPLRTFPRTTLLQYARYRLTQNWLPVLNYIDYVKKDAMNVLEGELGWRYYGGKHYESIYTRFYQGYILPRKFGYDKRRTHLSSLICSGETTRSEALHELEINPYTPEMQRQDREYVIKKFGLTDGEFEHIMNLPPMSYWDYPSYGRLKRNAIMRAVAAVYRPMQAALSRALNVRS